MKIRFSGSLEPDCGPCGFQPDKAEGWAGVQLTEVAGHSKTQRIDLLLSPLKRSLNQPGLANGAVLDLCW